MQRRIRLRKYCWLALVCASCIGATESFEQIEHAQQDTPPILTNIDLNKILHTLSLWSVSPVREVLNRTFDSVTGAGNILFGWEVESSNYGIVRYYRPIKDYDDASWTNTPDNQRASIFFHQLEKKKTKGPFGFVRMADAPAFLQPRLEAELFFGGSRKWEVKTIQPTRTLSDWLTQLDSVAFLPWTSIHAHVSFPIAASIDSNTQTKIAYYFMFANEYLTFKSYHHRPELIPILHVGPAPDDFFWRGIPLRLAYCDESMGSDRKGFFFRPRSISIYKKKRLGFEIAGPAIPLAELVEFMAKTALFLENPDTPMKFGSLGMPHPMSMDLDKHAPDFISTAVFDRLRAATFAAMKTAQTAILGPLDEEAVSMDAAHFMLYRWSMPLVRWDERPFLSHLKQPIETAKTMYLEEVDAIATDSSLSNHPLLMAERFNHALSTWVNQTQLWKYY